MLEASPEDARELLQRLLRGERLRGAPDRRWGLYLGRHSPPAGGACIWWCRGPGSTPALHSHPAAAGGVKRSDAPVEAGGSRLGNQSNGLAIWTLLGGRIVWRLRSGLPPWPPEITTRQRQLLYAVEGVLYLAMFAMPLSGMALSMVAGFPISLFGWFEIPGLLGESDLWHGRLEALHGLGAKAFLATILAHALLVLALDRGASPGFLARMLPSSRERRD